MLEKEDEQDINACERDEAKTDGWKDTDVNAI